jgi:hypothetical protein
MVQRRAARFVTGDYRTTSSVTQMLEALQWTEFQQHRTISYTEGCSTNN